MSCRRHAFVIFLVSVLFPARWAAVVRSGSIEGKALDRFVFTERKNCCWFSPTLSPLRNTVVTLIFLNPVGFLTAAPFSSPWLCVRVSEPWLCPASLSFTYSPFCPPGTSSGPRPYVPGGGSVCSTPHCGPGSTCGLTGAPPPPRRPSGWSSSCGSSALSCGSCSWSSPRWRATSAPWAATPGRPGWTSSRALITTRSSRSAGGTPWPPTWTRCCVCSPASATTGIVKHPSVKSALPSACFYLTLLLPFSVYHHDDRSVAES